MQYYIISGWILQNRIQLIIVAVVILLLIYYRSTKCDKCTKCEECTKCDKKIDITKYENKFENVKF